MNNIKKYLVRKLAIIDRDGQFHDYGLCYVSAEEESGSWKNIEITAFERERAGVVFVDSLTLREESKGLFVPL